MVNERYYPLLATLAVCALLYGYGMVEYRAFSGWSRLWCRSYLGRPSGPLWG